MNTSLVFWLSLWKQQVQQWWFLLSPFRLTKNSYDVSCGEAVGRRSGRCDNLALPEKIISPTDQNIIWPLQRLFPDAEDDGILNASDSDGSQ